MAKAPQFMQHLRDLIARDDLPEALQQLRALLDNSPKLDEAIHQSGRFQYIRRQIRLGVVSHAEATLTQNQIRAALLDLLREIEEQGEQPAIREELERAISVMDSKNVVAGSTIQAGGNVHIGDIITHFNVTLPPELAQNLLADKTLAANNKLWVKNLRTDLLKQDVAVGEAALDIFQHYGWLVQTFLYKMCTPVGSEPNARRLSYMVETWQSSLRYLCCIQVAQILQLEQKPQHPLLSDFLQMHEKEYLTFDYLNLLKVTTNFLQKGDCFMPEIHDLTAKLSDAQNDLRQTALFLGNHRQKLLAGDIPPDKQLAPLLDEYGTALVFWLRKIAFLAKYRLVSVKDINLQYRLGTSSKFKHLYGELHGIYSNSPGETNYKERLIEGIFTYNHSILLFKGSDVATCLKNIRDPRTWVSLSPLLIDQSVLVERPTQTPELYYFTGQPRGARKFSFAHYQNELPCRDYDPGKSNKEMHIGYQNDEQPKLDDLFEHIEEIFKPFKTPNQ